MRVKSPEISLVIPAYNEGAGIGGFYKDLKAAANKTGKSYEIIFINDGSKDDTLKRLHALAKKDAKVFILNLVRNFGKEIALSAGLAAARGEAIITLDADGQHPPKLIPRMLKKWELSPAQVLVGIRRSNQQEGFVKKYGSRIFYRTINSLSKEPLLTPGATDFRVVSRDVVNEFNKLTERHRISRGLIEWMGHQKEHFEFDAPARTTGEAGYSFRKLVTLALHSIAGLSLRPLYISSYLGAFSTIISFCLFIFLIVESLILNDPLHIHAKGSAYLATLILLLVGILLSLQGILGYYLGMILTEVQNRPLYLIDKSNSKLPPGPL